MYKFKTGYCFTGSELFHNFNNKRVKISTPIFRGKRNCQNKKKYFSQVLTYCFYLIILDIIENNTTFVLPLPGRDARIQVKSFFGDKFKDMYRKGMFKGIDFLNSNFTGYMLSFCFQNRNDYREKPIYINSKLKKIFYKNINNGKQYY